MIKKILIFIFLSIPAFSQITKKQLSDVPPVAEVVQIDPILLSIGDKQFTTKEFIALYKRNLQNDSLPEKTPKQFLDQFIALQLKLSKAEKDGKDTTLAFKEEMATITRELSSSFMVEKPVNDALIKEAYERLGSEINVSHILISLKDFSSPEDTLAAFKKITELREKLINGENFKDVAIKYSQDASVSKNEGNLGYITAFQTIYPFESASYTTPIGKISNPFRTPFGYHIVKVNAKREFQRWKIAHIFIAVNTSSAEVIQNAAKTKINEIYTKLEKGENWDKLCKTYSEDATTNSKGGAFNRLFGTDELEKPFEDALFALKKNGSYSPPIKTSMGWHIVKLIEKQGLKPFNEMYNFIQNKIAVDSRSELGKKAFLQRIKKENAFTEYRSVVNDAIKLIDSTLISKSDPQKLRSDLLDKTIFQIGSKNITSKKFVDFVVKKTKQNKSFNPNQYQLKVLNNWYDEFVSAENMIYEEENLGKKNQEFGNLMREYREGLLTQDLMESQVWDKAIQDTTQQRKYYEKNKLQYSIPERVKAQVIDANSIENLKKARDLFNKSPYPISIKWRDLYYPLNFFDLDESQKSHLDNLVLLLLKNTDYVVQISGNIDPEETENVSNERSKSVVKYLTSQRIPLSRIIEKDNGKFQPISKTEREKNRRVSFELFTNNKQDIVKLTNSLKPESLKVIEGTFKKGDNKTIDNLKWEVGQQQIDKGGRYIWANIEKIDPYRLMTLDEARGKVTKAIQIELENKMIEKLKNIFPVIVNEEQLKKVSK
jgi:peptidyl-prolyl cis-trans isomerase SurA